MIFSLFSKYNYTNKIGIIIHKNRSRSYFTFKIKLNITIEFVFIFSNQITYYNILYMFRKVVFGYEYTDPDATQFTRTGQGLIQDNTKSLQPTNRVTTPNSRAKNF